MEIKEFIEKAIVGGWKNNTYEVDKNNDGIWVSNPDETLHQSDVFLDPKAWEAVGKVEGWKGEIKRSDLIGDVIPKEWQINMHKMVSALISGKSLEEFIKTL